MQEGPHLDVLLEALDVEADAQRLLVAGEPGAADGFRRAAELYQRSWELAPPRSFGRLIGMLKAAILSGDGAEAADAARYVRGQLGHADSAPSSYACAVAALVLGDDEGAARAAGGMRAGDEAFGRAADAIEALATGDRAAYEHAVDAIVADFAGREEHLTGVRIADTALMLDRLAQARDMAVGPPLSV